MPDLQFWVSAAQWLLMGGIGLYAHLAKRDAANTADVNDLSRRVTTLEEQMRHLPDQALVGELAGDMKAVKAELQGVREALGPLARSVERVNDYLLSHKS